MLEAKKVAGPPYLFPAFIRLCCKLNIYSGKGLEMSESVNSIEPTNIRSVRQKKNEFLKEVASYRPDLFRFCRRLTNNPWDAEDLVQETILIAYGKLADKHAGIENIKSYLFKMATNQWLTWCRRKKIQANFDEALLEPIYQDEIHVVQDSLSVLLDYLPPKERVALVLSEVFESKNEEIAEIMGKTEGAVKSALARAREKLKQLNTPESISREKRRNLEDDRILELAVQAFNRRDIDSFAKHFAVNAIGNAPGCFFETGADEIKSGSLFYTMNTHDGNPQPISVRAERIWFQGEPLFVLFDGDKLDDIWKFTVEDDEILRFDCYYCCPDVLNEVAQLLGKDSNNHGYWFEQYLRKE